MPSNMLRFCAKNMKKYSVLKQKNNIILLSYASEKNLVRYFYQVQKQIHVNIGIQAVILVSLEVHQ